MMLLVSLLLLWLAIAKKFEPLLLLPIGFGGLLSNTGGRAGAHRPESLLAHHDPAQLAVIAAKLHCAPDVHAIKAALAPPCRRCRGRWRASRWTWAPPGCWPSSIRWRLARASRRWSSLWASER
ncbi:sodium ion-translocating decarboxylase subunit beta [Klebsiella pneumoniae]|uniref:Sodium ion-translocating decarboxylase subunit beta n=1 Tax=Klebsiella pneumoniae TaxID=573 RepID=A0A939NML8_KLEPN|nr:sodium ion-translocating decarboxylase subunit beta [Klebsiella pneumoniae]